MEKAKVCPSCHKLVELGKTNCNTKGCKYVFNGTEKGTSPRSIKMVMGSTIPTVDEISKIMPLLDSITNAIIPNDVRTEQVKNIFLLLCFCFGIVLIGSLVAFIFSPLVVSYKTKSNILFIFGIISIAVGIMFFMSNILSISKKPSLESPQDTINTFYNEGIFIYDFAKAWLSTSSACMEFKNIKEFKSHWENVLSSKPEAEVNKLIDSVLGNVQIVTPEKTKWRLRKEFEVRNINKENITAKARVVTFDICIKLFRIATFPGNMEFELMEDEVIFPHKRVLVKTPDNKWLLTSGSFDSSLTIDRIYNIALT